MQSPNSILFAVNGERMEANLSELHPSTTLLEYIRHHTKYRAPKLGCGEGGCGACTVLVSKYNSETCSEEEYTAPSCLTLVGSVDGCSITTSEGLGNKKDGFHAIHSRIAGFHASQCGFCTPGMCMAIYGALSKAQNKGKFNTENGVFNISSLEAEKSIQGNLCRCTGYRPLADACKSFAADVDLEDLGLNSFWAKNEKPDLVKLPSFKKVNTIPGFLKNGKSSVNSDRQGGSVLSISYQKIGSGQEYKWIKPGTLKDLLNILETLPRDDLEVKLVVGNTSAGVYKEFHPTVFIDISSISELNIIKLTNDSIEVGAAVTISKLIESLEDYEANHNSSSKQINCDSVFRTVANHLKQVATVHVRNTGSIGGNLMMAKTLSFDSDIATVLLGLGASVKVISAERQESLLEMDEFLAKPCLDPGSLLFSVIIPHWNEAASVNEEKNIHRYLFKTYRASPRPLGNAVSYVNAAFLIKIASEKQLDQCKIEHAQLAFGAFGTAHSIRASAVENFLIGKVITPAVLLEAIEILKERVVPDKKATKASYRRSVAVGFLFHFFLPFLGSGNELDVRSEEEQPNYVKLNGNLHGGDCQKPEVVHAEVMPKSLVVGKQVMEIHNDFAPVGQPVEKIGAELQASGEAVYVDDIPSPPHCLHGAFVLSEMPLALIKKIDLKDALESPGNVSFISSKDIPNGGQNLAIELFGVEPLFAEGTVECVGQPIGLMVADTWQEAKAAADKVKVAYDSETLGHPILTPDDAIAKESYHNVPDFLAPKPVGNFEKGMFEADHKIESAEVFIGSQYYFYLETQTALAIPDEDESMTVYSSNQNPSPLQSAMATCLGIPENKVRIITRRVGGGFGGKAYRAMPVAVACALASHKLKSPVRMYLDRKTDMLTTGGRHPVTARYMVGFKNDGKITALHVALLIDSGFSSDVSPMMPLTIISALKKYNWGAFSFDCKVCKTNLPSKSAMRGPGDSQGSFIAETIIEHVAASTGLDANLIRERNFHTFETAQLFYGNSIEGTVGYTLPAVWEKLKHSASLDARRSYIATFNSHQKWKKRGLSVIPCVYEVAHVQKPARVTIFADSSIAVEVGGIEIGQGLWTKVTQITAYTLSQLQPAGNVDFLSKIRVMQADSISLAHGGVTGGSTTSEASCAAVQQACNILVERLRTIKSDLEKNKPNGISWNELIQQACGRSLDLSAQTLWTADPNNSRYANYGAAAAEVEIDLLTGACVILQADILYDCGRSLNPAVDLGQIEGAFVQGIGHLTTEEYVVGENGNLLSNGTWTYKVPTIDSIPRRINVEFFNSPVLQKHILSSKASGEPPLILAPSVHCAIREAIRAARQDHWGDSCYFRMDSPATMDVIKSLCGFDIVENYLKKISKP